MVPVEPTVTGAPQDGYLVGEKLAYPDKILVRGDPDILNKMNTISTEEVDVTALKTDVNVKKNIVFPSGISAVNGEKDVDLTIKIDNTPKKYFKILKEDISTLNIDSKYSYKINTKFLDVEIKGEKNKLGEVDIKNVKPTIDLKNIQKGLYNIPLKLDLPDGTKLIDTYAVEVEVSDK